MTKNCCVKVKFVSKEVANATYECEEPGAKVLKKTILAEMNGKTYRITSKTWLFSYEYEELLVQEHQGDTVGWRVVDVYINYSSSLGELIGNVIIVPGEHRPKGLMKNTKLTHEQMTLVAHLSDLVSLV